VERNSVFHVHRVSTIDQQYAETAYKSPLSVNSDWQNNILPIHF